MRNKLGDLNDLLFEEITRLANEDLNKDKWTKEVSRAKAMVAVAEQIISNAQVFLDAMIMADKVPGLMKIGILGVDENENIRKRRKNPNEK
jgi:hypothetical protein